MPVGYVAIYMYTWVYAGGNRESFQAKNKLIIPTYKAMRYINNYIALYLMICAYLGEGKNSNILCPNKVERI
jgi:hypothetical protein